MDKNHNLINKNLKLFLYINFQKIFRHISITRSVKYVVRPLKIKVFMRFRFSHRFKGISRKKVKIEKMVTC